MALPLRKHGRCWLTKGNHRRWNCLPRESKEEKPVITQLEAGQTIEIEGPVEGLTGMIEVRREGHA